MLENVLSRHLVKVNNMEQAGESVRQRYLQVTFPSLNFFVHRNVWVVLHVCIYISFFLYFYRYVFCAITCWEKSGLIGAVLESYQ